MISLFQQFIPGTTHEWVLSILCIVLLICLLCYNKAILKCKSLIEQYVDEGRNAKLFSDKLKECLEHGNAYISHFNSFDDYGIFGESLDNDFISEDF